MIHRVPGASLLNPFLVFSRDNFTPVGQRHRRRYWFALMWFGILGAVNVVMSLIYFA